MYLIASKLLFRDYDLHFFPNMDIIIFVNIDIQHNNKINISTDDNLSKKIHLYIKITTDYKS
jgi:hypothetical protein